MNSVLNFIHEIDVKNKEKGNRYIHKLLLISGLSGLLLGLVASPILPIEFSYNDVNFIPLWLINSYMLMIIFMCGGVLLFTIISTGQVAKPRLGNVKSIVDFVTNAPNKDEIIQILNTLNDIVKKNAIQSYATLAEVFSSLYKRVGRVEERLDDHDVELKAINEKIIVLENKERQHLENERLYLNHNQRLSNELQKEWEKNVRLENEKKKLSEKLQRSVPLEEYEQLSSRLLNVEEELKKLKSD